MKLYVDAPKVITVQALSQGLKSSAISFRLRTTLPVERFEQVSLLQIKAEIPGLRIVDGGVFRSELLRCQIDDGTQFATLHQAVQRRATPVLGANSAHSVRRKFAFLIK